MSTTNKNFKVKNGLNVAGTATFDTNIVLGTTPIAFDTNTNRLKVYINNAWQPIALYSEIPDMSQMLTFMDVGLSIDYNGDPTYIIQSNGVTPSATAKILDGGSPTITTVDYIFDSGALQL